MIIDIFNEIPWQAFQNLEYVKKLSLNEQKEKYDKYISEVELARDYYYQYQVKGAPNDTNPFVSCLQGMDVVFIIDYTSSMRTAINNVKSNVIDIVDNTIIPESGGDYRLGLVIFDEYSGTYTTPSRMPYGTSLDYTDLPAAQKIINQGTAHFQVLTAMEVMSSQNESSFKTQLNVLNTNGPAPSPDFPIGNGDGTDEPGDLASEQIVDNDFAGSFRSNVAKLCIIITDAPPGGENDNYDQDVIDRLTQTAANASNDSIQFLVMSSIAISSNTGYRILSDNTGGIYENSFTPSAIIQAIEDLCTDNA